MPATSEPASGSVMPRQRIFSPLIAGTTHSCFCSSVPNARIGGIAMSVWTATPIARPPRARVHDLLGEHERRVVVAALAAVLLGLVEAEEARARPSARKTQSGNVVSSHSSACGASSFVHERADRLAQLLVLVGEDEVLARGGEVGLEDVGGWRSCHEE